MHFSNVAICMSIVVCYNCFLNERQITSKKWKCLGQTNTCAHGEDFEFVYPPQLCYVSAVRDCIAMLRLRVSTDALTVLNGKARHSVFPHLCCVVSKWRNCGSVRIDSWKWENSLRWNSFVISVSTVGRARRASHARIFKLYEKSLFSVTFLYKICAKCICVKCELRCNRKINQWKQYYGMIALYRRFYWEKNK